MKDLIQSAHDVQKTLLEFNWEFCFIGGLAVQQWGEPRLTRDIDLTILAGFGQEKKFIDKLLKAFKPRIKDAKQFALDNRVLLLKTKEGVGIDISLGGIPFEELVVGRAESIEILPKLELKICSPEDLVVLKAFASREIDWMDIRGIILRQGTSNLDWNYIEEQLTPLANLKEDPEILSRLFALKLG